MIKPTVGRVVWYHPCETDPGPNPSDQPLCALVAHVWSDTCVNLAIFDANGSTYSKTSVLLLQDEMERPGANYAEWMPYQKGQAAKAEQLEAKIASA